MRVTPSGRAFLDAQYEKTTEGAAGQTATESGTLTYEAGELPGTKALRIGDAGHVQYSASGSVGSDEGSILVRVKNDDWNGGGATQYAVQVWLDSQNHIDIRIDTSAEELTAEGIKSNKSEWGKWGKWGQRPFLLAAGRHALAMGPPAWYGGSVCEGAGLRKEQCGRPGGRAA